MRFPARVKLPVWCASIALLVASGCGGDSPTSPSPTDAPRTGAVIAGSVSGSGGASFSTLGLGTSSGGGVSPKASSPFTGLTVRLAGTELSALVGENGGFQLTGVPGGNARLQFKGGSVDATAEIANVSTDQFIQIQVELSGTSATIVDELRTAKVSLCHAEGNGTYHLIDVSVEAEATHRAHGDGKIGDPVPGRQHQTFDGNCRPVGPAIDVEKSTNNDDADTAPGASISVGTPITWRYVVTNTGTLNLTGITVVDDQGVVVNCSGQTTLATGASMTCTASGLVSALGPYRNLGTATGSFSGPTGSGTVSDSDPSHYMGISPIQIEKWTNGEDADVAPGPSILVGDPVTWEYQLTNIGVVALTNVSVSDDRGVAVNCSGQTTLAAGAAMTCTGAGVAGLGQYSNVGTVTASWSAGTASGTVTDSDPSHYLGITPDQQDGPKVSLCHRTGAGFYVLISVSVDAEPAHRAHGDAAVGQAVPGVAGRVFGANCSVQ